MERVRSDETAPETQQDVNELHAVSNAQIVTADWSLQSAFNKSPSIRSDLGNSENRSSCQIPTTSSQPRSLHARWRSPPMDSLYPADVISTAGILSPSLISSYLRSEPCCATHQLESIFATKGLIDNIIIMACY